MNRLKLVFAGASAVGKTSLIYQYLHKYFDENGANTTLTAAYVKHEIDKNTTIDIWDTAGQERFNALTPAYFKGAAIIALVFSQTDRQSFDQLGFYFDQAQSRAPNAKLYILGNKCDVGEQCIEQSKIDEVCSQHNAKYYAVSAKTGQNVQEFINDAVKNEFAVQEVKKISFDDESQQKGGCC